MKIGAARFLSDSVKMGEMFLKRCSDIDNNDNDDVDDDDDDDDDDNDDDNNDDHDDDGAKNWPFD